MPWWYGSPASGPSWSFTTIGTPRNGPSESAARLVVRTLVARVDDRVERRVARLGTLDRGVDELGGAQLARRHELGLRGGIEGVEVVGSGTSRTVSRDGGQAVLDAHGPIGLGEVVVVDTGTAVDVDALASQVTALFASLRSESGLADDLGRRLVGRARP